MLFGEKELTVIRDLQEDIPASQPECMEDEPIPIVDETEEEKPESWEKPEELVGDQNEPKVGE